MNECVREQPLLGWYGFIEYRQPRQTYGVIVSLIPSTMVLRICALREVDIQNDVVLLVELRLRRQFNRTDWQLDSISR